NFARRSLSESEWNDASEIHISHSERYYMTKIYKKQHTIASVTQNVHISRHAIHIFIKSLAAKELVEVQNVENNRKEKCIRLTALGEEYYEKHEALKVQMENKIAEKIGKDQMKALKDILRADWGV